MASHVPRPPGLLRALARVLVRGPDAEEVLEDLEELWRRERAGGSSSAGSALRYAGDAGASAWAIWRARIRVPGLGRMSSLDVVLAARMLLKYPGLTLVATLAMSWVMALALLLALFRMNLVHPTVPLDEGERVVAILNRGVPMGQPYQWSRADLASWREALETIEDLSAYGPLAPHLITDDGRAAPVAGVRISASAFRLARVPPMLGRVLRPQDEIPGAPLAIVIGHELWRRRFGADPQVVGRLVRLGATPATVVGVMPPGFAFPVHEELWVPLRTDASEASRRESAEVNLFGRLREGATLAQAQAEVQAAAEAIAVLEPVEAREGVRATVAPFPELWRWGLGPNWRVSAVEWPLILLLLLASANLAVLVFARSCTREREIAIRSALGASRGRIVAQLFVEALALVSVAGVLALAASEWGLRSWSRLLIVANGGDAFLPFWWSTEIGLGIVARIGLLTLGASAIVGCVPALRLTRPGIRGARGRGDGPRFGALATGIVVGQVAVSVMLWSFAAEQALELGATADLPGETEDANTYLQARLHVDAPAGGDARLDAYHRARQELADELRSDPAVLGVTFAGTSPVVPGPIRRVEVDGADLPLGTGSGYPVRSLQTDSRFFDVFDRSVSAGRSFDEDFVADTARAEVVVEESFAREVFGGSGAVGHRLRYVSADGAGPWRRIVGVVADVASVPSETPRVYEPLPPAARPLTMILRARGNADDLSGRVRASATRVSPSLRLERLMSREEAVRRATFVPRFAWALVTLLGVTALVLCLAGIYALMSFLVDRRHGEIGVRTALGANPRRVITTIFGRALLQLAGGAVAGVGLVVALRGGNVADGGRTLVAVTALVVGMGVLACVLPAARALRIQPTDALREL